MLNYDPDHPLIFIHTPKTAGTSVKVLFQQWFGEGLLPHYYKEAACEMPVRHDIFALHTRERPVVVYGHFNRRRHFGLEDYYPEARQCITLLRDPLDRMVSNYFYLKKVAHGWKKHTEPLDAELESFLLKNKSTMLSYFPREVSAGNYKEIIAQYFIDIGTVETLDRSLQRIAAKLGRPYQAGTIGRENATERDQPVSDRLRDIFVENNRLEYEVFDYVSTLT